MNSAIKDRREGRVADEWETHKIVSKLYTWQDVARRTEIVYDHISKETKCTLQQKLKK